MKSSQASVSASEGAQGYFNVDADLVTYGKIIGAGMPVGAYGGRRDVMSMVSPVGPVYQAGTLSGNPVAMQAGMTQLTHSERASGNLYGAECEGRLVLRRTR